MSRQGAHNWKMRRTKIDITTYRILATRLRNSSKQFGFQRNFCVFLCFTTYTHTHTHSKHCGNNEIERTSQKLVVRQNDFVDKSTPCRKLFYPLISFSKCRWVCVCVCVPFALLCTRLMGRHSSWFLFARIFAFGPYNGYAGGTCEKCFSFHDRLACAHKTLIYGKSVRRAKQTI